jgi:hypothetical protein
MVLDAWREREDKRKAACVAYDLAWRQHDELRRRLAPPVEQIETIVGARATPALAALFVRLDDVQRFAEPPPSPPALTPIETGDTQPSPSQKPGRPAQFDEAGIKNLAREMVRRDGLPASQQNLCRDSRTARLTPYADGRL